ncbi:PAP-specific phosphatase HAL2-like [Impatiens glandulifera]|uniref:PAP-specific phosphatase HAL2-like n=1 Tax=Impatiens glandulifera TaxID=253017 RepID=UPI001FB138D0|nr:PAP-specific phosphatase HAL2-like [Impatiens glandulifera]
METEKFRQELDIAVRVVHLACSLCRKVQQSLVSSRYDQSTSKDDDSPVTIADWSVQAMVSWMLSEHFGSQNLSIMAEEDTKTLLKPDSSDLLTTVVKTVNECLDEAPKYGLKSPLKALDVPQVLHAISRCNSNAGTVGRHWILDPVDGTLGFLRLDQYAVALALIDNGQVVIGVLGCPNYSMRKDGMKLAMSNNSLLVNNPSENNKGCVMFTARGSGKAWMQPMIGGDEEFEWLKRTEQIRVSSINDPAQATFCEPVERANSNHSFAAELAHSVGLRKQPLRVYSMVKYAAIAKGDAEIFMKFARVGYKEKIWDHAAGVLLVHEAGGVVTDAGGRQLDFSRGVYLEGLDRGIIACSGADLHNKIVNAIFASWDSSSL